MGPPPGGTQRHGHQAFPADRVRRADRSDERLLHDHAAGLQVDGTQALRSGFQDSPRPVRIVPGAVPVCRAPYTFAERRHGESKFDANAGWEYLVLLFDKLTGGVVPVRFLLFSAVGAVGLAVHLAVLCVALVGFDFAIAQAIATVAAMTGNLLSITPAMDKP